MTIFTDYFSSPFHDYVATSFITALVNFLLILHGHDMNLSKTVLLILILDLFELVLYIFTKDAEFRSWQRLF